MYEYLDPVMKTHQCAQYLDELGIAAIDTIQLTVKICEVFKCIRNAGLKLIMSKCHFGVKQVDFLGRTITTKGVAPQMTKIKKYLSKINFQKHRRLYNDTLIFLTTIEATFQDGLRS